MKRGFRIILFLLWSIGLNATTYYVSNSGSDSNDGLSTGTPFLTIAKVNTLTLVAGDFVLFNRGDVFRGSITVGQSGTVGNPITFGAYGTGALPIITGVETLTGWTNSGGNIWTKTYTGSNVVTEVFINGEAQIVGRFPKVTDANKGYYLADSGTTTTITDEELPTSPTWIGAEVVVRTAAWVFEMRKVTARSGNTLTLESATTYTTYPYSGYFFQHDPQACTVQGEWAYNKTTKVISIYSASDPNLDTIDVTAYDKLFNIVSKNYITIENLSLKGTSAYLVYGSLANNIVVDNCELSDGMKGLYMANGSYHTLINSYIHDLRSNVFRAYSLVQNTTINDNVIENIANIAGMGTSGVGENSGINVAGDNFNCYRNKFTNLGYLGIGWRGQNAMIKYNFIDTFCQVIDDGSAIYTYNGDNNFGNTIQCEVMYNTIINGVGAPEGSKNQKGEGNGIYCDDGSRNVKIWYNTIMDIATYGMYFHNADEIDVQYNTYYNTWQDFRFYDDGLHANTCINNTIQNNTVIKMNEIGSSMIYSLQGGTAMKTGNTINNNRFIVPYSNPSMATYYFGAGDFDVTNTFTEWKALWGAGYDSASTYSSPITLTTESFVEYAPLFYNETDTAKYFTLTAAYVDKDGLAVISPLTLPAYSSKVLFKTGEIPTPPVPATPTYKIGSILGVKM